jgi:hypothetical protein
MNQWLNSSVGFSDHSKLFTLSGRSGIAHRRIVEALRDMHCSGKCPTKPAASSMVRCNLPVVFLNSLRCNSLTTVHK